MKALIWILCFFVATILNTLLGYATGVKVGYLIFYFVVYFVAKKLCDKWDEHKNKKQSKTVPIDEDEVNNDKISFCRKCGEPLIDSSKFCRKCGTEIVEEVFPVVMEENENKH